MTYTKGSLYPFRDLTRQEKTCIRRDAKRFEKIARDHGCITLEHYFEFTNTRLRWDAEGLLTLRSAELIRGLGAYFGNELLYATGFRRIAADFLGDDPADELLTSVAAAHPGWPLLDPETWQTVIIPWIISDRMQPSEYDPASLDDIFDEIIGWNQGYLVSEDVQTRWINGPDVGLEEYLAA